MSMAQGVRSLVWFRSDLRVADNTALFEACRRAGGASGKGVVAVFLLSPGEWAAHDFAPIKVDFILRSLAVLSADLAKLNIPLLIETAKTPKEIPGALVSLAKKHGCDELHFNKEYEVNEQKRDVAVIDAFSAARLKAFSHTDQICVEPGEIRTGEGRFFTVYSPFKRAFFKHWDKIGGCPTLAKPSRQAETGIAPSPVPETHAASEPKGLSGRVHWRTRWPAGEHEAMKRLRQFCADSIVPYKDRRDFPGIDGTSMLSHHLAVGTISPRQCLEKGIEANLTANTGLKGSPLEIGSTGPVHWISEVLWREFYVHVMVGFPRVCMHRAFQVNTEAIVWNDQPKLLEAWKHGRTGVPIVDAGMRQLLRDGWMHNRVRMIVAMYFTKDYFLNWRLGEKFFMQNLIDGFLASNNGGWQWSASTGTDAAPYFRIFNTYNQSEKFDPDGKYIREFVPELRDVQGPAIHDPQQLPGLLRTKLDYPDPLVDRVKAREKAIDAFRKLRPV
jgi:deoxyribodipyrimidine photo-lyase